MQNKLTAEIQRLVPELLEKKFGLRYIDYANDHCVLLCSKCQTTGKEYFAFSCQGDAHDWAGMYGEDMSHRKYKNHTEEEFEKFKILGHPISLEHLRIAIWRRNEELGLHEDKALPFLARLHDLWIDLTPFEAQTDKLKTFLSQYLLPTNK